MCVPCAFLASVLGRVSVHLLREGTCVPVSTDGGIYTGVRKGGTSEQLSKP